MVPDMSKRYEEFHHLDQFPNGIPPEEKGPEAVEGRGPLVKCPRCWGYGWVPVRIERDPFNGDVLRDFHTGAPAPVGGCPVCNGHGSAPLSKWATHLWDRIRSALPM